MSVILSKNSITRGKSFAKVSELGWMFAAAAIPYVEPLQQGRMAQYKRLEMFFQLSGACLMPHWPCGAKHALTRGSRAAVCIARRSEIVTLEVRYLPMPCRQKQRYMEVFGSVESICIVHLVAITSKDYISKALCRTTEIDSERA